MIHLSIRISTQELNELKYANRLMRMIISVLNFPAFREKVGYEFSYTNAVINPPKYKNKRLKENA